MSALTVGNAAGRRKPAAVGFLLGIFRPSSITRAECCEWNQVQQCGPAVRSKMPGVTALPYRDSQSTE